MSERRILALGEPMVEFNQTGADDGKALPAGLRRRHLELRGRRRATGRERRLRLGPRRRCLRCDAAALWRRKASTRRTCRPIRRVHRPSISSPTTPAATTSASSGAARRRAGSGRSGCRARRSQAASVLHLSGISLAISETACDAGLAAIEIARSAGVPVSFDTNLRLKLWPVERARRAIGSASRKRYLPAEPRRHRRPSPASSRPEAVRRPLPAPRRRRRGPEDGRGGAWVADGQRRVRIAPHPCRPVDATGAGDVFGGAFVAASRRGRRHREAGRYAAVAAALSTEGYGAVAPIPHAARRAALRTG